MTTPHGPLRNIRLITLALAWSFAVIAGSTGLNALIKSNQSQSFLKKKAPPPTVVTIDVSDAFDAGVLATTATTLISVLIFNYVSMMFIPKLRALSTRTLKLQAASLVFCVIWVIAAQVAFTLFYATREAQVHAFIGTTELPASIVQAAEKAAGATGVYKELSYLTLAMVFPWLAALFTSIAAAVLFVAGSRANVRTTNSSSSSLQTVEKEHIEEVDK